MSGSEDHAMGHGSVRAAELSEEDQAMAYLDDLFSAGNDMKMALSLAVRYFPAQGALLAEYAVERSGRVNEAEGAAHDDLEELVESAAIRMAARPTPALSGVLARAREQGLELAVLCARLRVGRSVVTKLERRMIDLATVPASFLNTLAAELSVGVESVRAYLASGARLSPELEFKHKGTPASSGRKQSFDEALDTAVAAGEMTREDRNSWRAGGPVP